MLADGSGTDYKSGNSELGKQDSAADLCFGNQRSGILNLWVEPVYLLLEWNTDLNYLNCLCSAVD